MTIVSLDLAMRRYRDNGIAVLSGDDSSIACALSSPSLDGPPTPGALADHLLDLCRAHDATCLLIDGPQAWKAQDNGLPHQRVCERELHTPGKTGPPGVTKPGTWRTFAVFSVALFDELAAKGWPRLDRRTLDDAPPRRVAIESFPTAAWRRLGLTPLPAKARATAAQVERHFRTLTRIFPIACEAVPDHDQLQALVAGLGGIALERGLREEFDLVGSEPALVDGTWREGYILSPRRCVETAPLFPG